MSVDRRRIASKAHLGRKEGLIRAATEARAALLGTIEQLSPSEQERVFLGSWSVHEVLAHLVGWDHTNAAAVKSLLRSKLPAFYAYRDPDWQTYNAGLVRRFGGGSMGDLVAAARRSHEDLMSLLERVPAADYEADFGVRFRGYRVTIRRLIESETTDEETHCRQIAEYFQK